jgi:hypothetical protein
LFRSLFRGREDVYAIRWENNDGRSGYMPKADRDWKSYLSAKDEDRKKVDRLTRTYRPLTDEVIHGHLVGKQTVGIYPLLQDETCWLLAVDFDKKAWQEDTAALLAACSELSVPAALERSRSGKGECHHLSAFTFEQVLKQVKAKYVLGLTATPERKDGHHPIIYMQCGPIRYKLSARSMTASSPFEHEVIPRLTEFCVPPEQADTTIQELYAALVDDTARNELIVGDLLRAVQDGCSPLLLTARTEHLNCFETALDGRVENVFVLKGGMGKKQRRSIADAIAAVPEGNPRVILATGSYIGEGFDDARLDSLFLAMPISWKGTLQQYVGRLHRLHDAKRVVRVYDYVDSKVVMLARMYARRLKGYSVIGYRICNSPYEVMGAERQMTGLNRPDADTLKGHRGI